MDNGDRMDQKDLHEERTLEWNPEGLGNIQTRTQTKSNEVETAKAKSFAFGRFEMPTRLLR